MTAFARQIAVQGIGYSPKLVAVQGFGQPEAVAPEQPAKKNTGGTVVPFKRRAITHVLAPAEAKFAWYVEAPTVIFRRSPALQPLEQPLEVDTLSVRYRTGNVATPTFQQPTKTAVLPPTCSSCIDAPAAKLSLGATILAPNTATDAPSLASMSISAVGVTGMPQTVRNLTDEQLAAIALKVL